MTCCRHLIRYNLAGSAWTVASCSARPTPYVPGVLELNQFCRDSKHALCPFFLFPAAPQKPGRKQPSPAAAGEAGWRHAPG